MIQVSDPYNITLGTCQRRQSGLKSGGSWIRVKKFRFSKKNSEKFRLFQAISTFSGNFKNKKSIFQGKFPKKFDLLQVISQICSISQGQFPKNFDFLSNFTKDFDFLKNFPRNFDFFR